MMAKLLPHVLSCTWFTNNEGGMNGLALCAGVGGLELGLELALGESYKTVGYIERDAYAAANIVARMGDQALDRASIWDDIKSFKGKPWRSRVDIFSAGFPCQPFSTAGKKMGIADERWIWPTIDRIIGEVGPSILFLENVPGLLIHQGGMGALLGSLANRGFDAKWGRFSAKEVGSSQLRWRVFIMAYAKSSRVWGEVRDICKKDGGQEPRCLQRASGSDGGMAHAQSGRSQTQDGKSIRTSEKNARTPSTNDNVENPSSLRLERSEPLRIEDKLSPFPPYPNDIEGWKGYGGPQPALRRGPNGMAYWVDRIRVIGNGVVPLVAAYAFRTLAARAGLI